MKISKKHVFSLLIILIITVSAISIVSAYTGTGFTHNIPSSKYSDLSASDILSKYNKTDCHVEETGICTQVVDGDTIYLDNGEKVRFVGVNTPERGVEGYIASKTFVQKLCLNKKVGMPPSEFYPYNWANSSTHIPDSYKTYTHTSDTSSSSSGSGKYIGNSNSGKFHESSCKWGQKTAEHNRVYFNNRNTAISQGYVPCKVCNP